MKRLPPSSNAVVCRVLQLLSSMVVEDLPCLQNTRNGARFDAATPCLVVAGRRHNLSREWVPHRRCSNATISSTGRLRLLSSKQREGKKKQKKCTSLSPQPQPAQSTDSGRNAEGGGSTDKSWESLPRTRVATSASSSASKTRLFHSSLGGGGDLRGWAPGKYWCHDNREPRRGRPITLQKLPAIFPLHLCGEAAAEMAMGAALLSELYELLDREPRSVFVLERLTEAWAELGDEGKANSIQARSPIFDKALLNRCGSRNCLQTRSDRLDKRRSARDHEPSLGQVVQVQETPQVVEVHTKQADDAHDDASEVCSRH